MAVFDFGKIALTDEGEYSSSVTYERDCLVTHNDATWVSLQTTTDNEPVIDSEYWQLINKKGDYGPGPERYETKVTLVRENWVGNNPPYVYDISSILSSSLGDKYNSELFSEVYFDNDEATLNQIEQMLSADIYGEAKHKIYAYGEKPTISMPYIIVTYLNSNINNIDFDENGYYEREYPVIEDFIDENIIETSNDEVEEEPETNEEP